MFGHIDIPLSMAYGILDNDNGGIGILDTENGGFGILDNDNGGIGILDNDKAKSSMARSSRFSGESTTTESGVNYQLLAVIY